MSFSLRALSDVFKSHRFLSFVIFQLFIVTALFSIHYSLFTASAYAEPGPPNPKPCEDALSTGHQTKNVLDPLSFTVRASGTPGSQVTVSLNTSINVDFSKLQAVFGKSNSDYLESRFQDQTHRSADILSLPSSNFNSYHGPIQKTSPKIIIDDLRKKYVEYVYNKPSLAESANQYTDFNGNNPKTIYDLVNLYGLPNPPQTGQNSDIWNQTWGLYWDKLPTTVSEFYYGQLVFIKAVGQTQIQEFDSGQLNMCPLPLRTIYFVLPEFFRTTSVSGQLNQVMVPKAAQSYEKNLLSQTLDDTKEAFSKIVQACLKPISQTPLSNALKKVIKISSNFLNPIKNAYADEGCGLKILPDAKKTTDPFCALPALDPNGNSQLQSGDTCTNIDDPNKLDKNNPNVNCTFRITWSDVKTIPGDFDSCTDDNSDGVYDCTLQVKIWPEFYIPWLADIWNNTTYSDKNDASYVEGSEQITGQPGVYTLFKPKSADDTVFPKDKKNLPGNTENSTPSDLKQRFLGATDCNKNFSRDLSLKPKALQEALGINSPECNLQATVPPSPSPDNGSLDYYIKYGDTSIMPQMTKQDLLNLANSAGWTSNNINAHYDEVISQSISRGISPAFAISVWWEEGGFGGAGAGSEFGCFPGGNTSQTLDFRGSFNCFLDFTANEHPYNANDPRGSFTEWVRYFCGAAAVPICSNNPGFIDRLESIYNSVAPGEIIYVPN